MSSVSIYSGRFACTLDYGSSEFSRIVFFSGLILQSGTRSFLYMYVLKLFFLCSALVSLFSFSVGR